MQTLKEKDNQMLNLKEQLSNLFDELKQKEHRITDLEFELLTINTSDLSVSLAEKTDVDNEKNSLFWIQQIEEKDKEIERLESELRKRTCDLQGIVNKELWQKNREIEKLQNRYGTVIENKDTEITRLEQQLQLLKDKISEVSDGNTSDDIKTLQDRLNACQQERKYFMEQIEALQQKLQNIEESELAELQIEQKHLQEELERSEKIRVETNEVCACLSRRLEELAMFLDSLLQKKSVLGFLGWKQNSLIKQVVNQSLELSKTLCLTISQNPNQSLLEISNITALLSSTQNISVNVAELLDQKDDNAACFALIPSDATLTYQSHLHKTTVEGGNSIVDEQNKIISVLREQIQNLKREIELRDIELNKFATSPRKEQASKSSSAQRKSETHSESESWSEPDRTVSMARIGLDDDSLKPVLTTTRRSRFLTSVSTESTEDELSRTLTRTPSKRSLLAENRQTIISLHGEVCDLERKLKETEEELTKTRDDLNTEKVTNAAKQRQLDELLQKLKVVEDNLGVVEKRKQEAEKHVKQCEKTINALQIEKAELQAQLIHKDKIMLNRINELEMEKDRAFEAARAAEKVADTARADVANAEMMLKTVQRELETVEATVRNECDARCKTQCDALKNDFETRMQCIESRAKSEIEQTQSALKQLQHVLYTDYVEKCEVEKQTRHLESVLKELDETKAALYSTEMKLNELQRQEALWKEKIRDVQSQQWEKINALHKELDNVNLQYSEAVLEKTKLGNEKTALEHKLKSVDAKETDLMLQAAEFQKEVNEVKETFQKQIAVMESKKAKLEIRVSELESINAELKNKLIMLQTSINEQFLSASLPVNTNKLYEMYGQSVPVQQSFRRQFSDNSDYTSEDPPLEDNRFVNREIAQAAAEDMDRQNANSSPDLGIESDHGRFSSLEANIPRPLLQTLELTESMSNLLDNESQVQLSNCSKLDFYIFFFFVN